MHEPYFAFFVTPHGYGHMSRAIAVAESLRQHASNIRLEFFTTISQQHIASSLDHFDYYYIDCDVGLVQSDAFKVNLLGTVERLDRFLPFNSALIDQLAAHLLEQRCVAVISDIAPLGLEIATQAGLPSVLIENFTWDWIYREYRHLARRMEHHAEYLSSIFRSADLHLQCQPFCQSREGAIPTNPISRTIRARPSEIRKKLGYPLDKKIVFISMGGTSYSPPKVETLGVNFKELLFLIAGANNIQYVPENVHLLPADTTLYHPDLVNASDIVIGKVGYSTIAEVYQAGVPFGYFSRAGNPETPSLLSFLRTSIKGIHFTTDEYETGRWLDQLAVLLDMPRDKMLHTANGADQCAKEIINLVKIKSV